MDYQGLKFIPTTLAEEQLNPWLDPEPVGDKVSYRAMIANLAAGNWRLWRLREPASGLAVTYPLNGKLFVYYLRGHGLFGNLTIEDLLDVAIAEGCRGMAAETRKPGMLLILKKFGFRPIDTVGAYTYLELCDGRQ